MILVRCRDFLAFWSSRQRSIGENRRVQCERVCSSEEDSFVGEVGEDDQRTQLSEFGTSRGKRGLTSLVI